MRKVNLENLGLDSSEKLGRSQMKSIHGGIMLEGDDAVGCSVTCEQQGFYACCKSRTSCKCHPNIEAHECLSGGYGSKKCSQV